MACDGCSRLETSPVTLIDGRTVCTWCEAWRAECATRHKEARRILALPARVDRLAALDLIQARFGVVARERMHAAVLALWERERAKIAPVAGAA